MTKFSLLAFFTGLYFATLQFCYLILLQANISSTYLTYMLIVGSWFVGSIAGLWMKKLGTVTAIGMGTLSYYGVYLMVVHNPFSPVTLLLAGMGVVITGLWAGKFFIDVFCQYNRADRIFFHENNGFLLGILLFFAGFTLLGRVYTFWFPALLALTCLLVNSLIQNSKPPLNQ